MAVDPKNPFMDVPGWYAPAMLVYDIGDVRLESGRYTINMGPKGRLFVAPQREEEKMTDKAVELLAQQRFEEEQEKAHAEAEAIVAKVKALQVGSYVNGDKVMFTKSLSLRDGSLKTYTYLALRVIEDKKMWFVTGQQGPMTDFAFETLLARDGGFGVFTGLALLGPPQASNYMGWGADVNAPITSAMRGAPVIATDDAVAELPDEGA